MKTETISKRTGAYLYASVLASCCVALSCSTPAAKQEEGTAEFVLRRLEISNVVQYPLFVDGSNLVGVVRSGKMVKGESPEFHLENATLHILDRGSNVAWRIKIDSGTLERVVGQ